MITITGFSAAVSAWAPFALLAEAILTEPITPNNEVSSIRPANTRQWPQRQQGLHQGERDVLLAQDEDVDEETGLKYQRRDYGAQLSRDNIQSEDYASVSGEQATNGGVNAVSRSDRAVSSTLSSKAGIILGIHNIFIVIPQFLVSGLAIIVFAIFESPKPSSPDHRVLGGKGLVGSLLLDHSTQGEVEPHLDSMVYLFCMAGVAACSAFLLCGWLSREIRRRKA
jgi:solute carrier family 45 protein 1/2/4